MNTKHVMFGSVEFHGTIDKLMLLNVLVAFLGKLVQHSELLNTFAIGKFREWKDFERCFFSHGLVLYDRTVQEICCTGLSLTAMFCDIDAIKR